jgi:glycerol-3-phosphate dehydrogenase (NAD(P)+)
VPPLLQLQVPAGGSRPAETLLPPPAHPRMAGRRRTSRSRRAATPARTTTVAVLGDGGWGTTLARLLAGQGHAVTLWGAFPDYVAAMEQTRENVKFLPGFPLPPALRLTSDVAAACAGADLLVVAVPSQFLRGAMDRLAAAGVRPRQLVSVAKGIEAGTLLTMSQVIRDVLGAVEVAVLSGPCIAREVAAGIPAAATVAAGETALAAQVRELFSTPHFSLYENNDVVGVELGGAIKNVIAIGAGILQGLELGANTRAVLFARGLAEMARLGRALGARRSTFMGLSGLGDLATTCLSPHSRNRSFGQAIGEGGRAEEILARMEMVVEGVETARSVHALAARHGVAMPICEAVHQILFEGRPARSAIDALLHRHSHRELD